MKVTLYKPQILMGEVKPIELVTTDINPVCIKCILYVGHTKQLTSLGMKE